METENCNLYNFERKLILVEYPGVVENEEKAIKTLGGIGSISTTYSLKNRRLELRFRPDDAYCKPACGDRHKTLSILLKVKIRRKKNKNVPQNDYLAEDSDASCSSVPEEHSDIVSHSIQILGKVETAYKFRNLCDFQYLPMVPEFETHGPLVCKYDSLVPKGLPGISWLNDDAPYFLPPATFSRMDTMQQYLYRKESNDETGVPPNIIGRTRRRRSGHAIFIGFDSSGTPKKPQSVAVKLLRLKFLDGTHLQTLKEMFKERPVWSKNALMCLTKYTNDQLKYLLPCVAYYFVTGPWRIMWVRFGYDPRNDPEAVKYQTLDYRVRAIGGLKTKVNIKRSYCNYALPYKSCPSSRAKTTVLSKENLLPEREEVIEEKTTAPEDNTYSFYPEFLPPNRQTFYQYCDIKVPEIQEMLEKLPTPAPSTKCHERLGWMQFGMDDRCREIINKYVTNLLKQSDFVPTDAQNMNKDQEDQDKESEDEFEEDEDMEEPIGEEDDDDSDDEEI